MQERKLRPARTWSIALIIICAFLLLPLITPLVAVFSPVSELWRYFADTLLWTYTFDTIILCAGVLFCASILGVAPAWLLSRYRVPFHNVLETILILPLALPAYITAYAYSGTFDFHGPLWKLGTQLGLSAELLGRFGIGNMAGLIFIMSSALYPYVFLIVRGSLRFQLTSPLNAAQSLGAGQIRQFFGLSLPLCRPALFGALGIVLMETLNEYGAVDYLGQTTLSTGIFRIWFGHYDLPAAQRLGGLLLFTVFILLAAEGFLRGGRQYDPKNRRELEKLPCSPVKAGLFCIISLIPALLGFFFPLLQLAVWVPRALPGAQWSELLGGLLNTLQLAVFTGFFITVLGVLVSFMRKVEKNTFLRKISDLSLLGYSLPGSIIALGMLGISRGLTNMNVPIVLSGSIFLLIYAYVVRFLALSQRSISAVMLHQLKTQDDASRSLGYSSWQTLLRVHLPNLKLPIRAALSVIFLETIKELPLTIILRPFNFQTLAVRSYQLASDEMIQEASIPSLLLVIVAVCAMFILRRNAEAE
ncbi:MAG: ABC transporter permease [Salinispira sp.]